MTLNPARKKKSKTRYVDVRLIATLFAYLESNETIDFYVAWAIFIY